MRKVDFIQSRCSRRFRASRFVSRPPFRVGFPLFLAQNKTKNSITAPSPKIIAGTGFDRESILVHRRFISSPPSLTNSSYYYCLVQCRLYPGGTYRLSGSGFPRQCRSAPAHTKRNANAIYRTPGSIEPSTLLVQQLVLDNVEL